MTTPHPREAAPWPDGVPLLPDRVRTWVLRNRPYSDEKVWRKCDARDLEWRTTPCVTEEGGKIIRANAAARALGIVPDAEGDHQ